MYRCPTWVDRLLLYNGLAQICFESVNTPKLTNVADSPNTFS